MNRLLAAALLLLSVSCTKHHNSSVVVAQTDKPIVGEPQKEPQLYIQGNDWSFSVDEKLGWTKVEEDKNQFLLIHLPTKTAALFMALNESNLNSARASEIYAMNLILKGAKDVDIRRGLLKMNKSNHMKGVGIITASFDSNLLISLIWTNPNKVFCFTCFRKNESIEGLCHDVFSGIYTE